MTPFPGGGGRRFAVSLALALVGILPVALRPHGIPILAGARFTDLLVAHAPNALLLRRSLAAGDGVPLWNPHLAGGIPFAADPLSGIWYPPNWLAAALPIGLAFNLILWFHLAWACLGAWRLARSIGCGTTGAWIAAIAYSGSPKLLAHLGLGHLGLVSGMSWAPWTLAAAREALHKSPEPARGQMPAYLRAGVCLGLATLADPRAAFVTGLAAAAYAGYLLLQRGVDPSWRTRLGWPRQIGLGAAAVAAAAGVSAALWVPFSELVAQSSRAGLSSADSTSLALPPADLLQLVVPAAPVSGEWVTYLGIGTLALAALALVVPTPERSFWAGMSSAGWLLALGPLTPLYPLLGGMIPGMSLVRVPPRMLFLAVLGSAVLAGLGADRLQAGALTENDKRRMRRTTAAFALGVILLNLGLGRAAGDSSAIPPAGLWWAAILAAGAALSVELALRRSARPGAVAASWMGLLILDLAVFNIPRLTVLPPEASAEPSPVASYLAPRARGSRVLSLSYDIPQATAVEAGLRLADGVHPLVLGRYWDRMAETLAFPAQEYSVTLPPYPGGDPAAAWIPRIDAEELGELNIGWVVSAFPLPAQDGLRLERALDSRWLYSNPRLGSRAWVQSGLGRSEQVAGTASVRDVSSDVLEVEAEGPGYLVLAETIYPGWRARVDGEPAQLEAAGDLWRAVALPPGRHEVRFEFAPGRVGLGAAVSLVTLAAVAALMRRQ